MGMAQVSPFHGAASCYAFFPQKDTGFTSSRSALARYQAVIFDLYGTLLDTLEDLADSTNFALAAHGFPRRSLEEVRRFVGNGVGNLIRRAAPEGTSPEAVER